MALSLGELVAYLRVDSGAFDSGMDQSEGRFSGFAKKAATYGVAVGAGILAAGTALYQVGSTFDDVTDTIRVGTGATGKALDELVGSAKNIGRDIPASFESIGTTVADVNTRLGLTGPTLEKLSSQILEAGRLLGTEIDVNGLSAAFSAFNVTGDDTTAVMDDLFRISQATGVGINELAAGVATGAPQLRQFGFSIGESAALLGTLDKAGMNSDATIAALSRGMINFAKDGKKPRAALEETIEGIEGFIAKGDQAKALDLAAEIFGTRGAGQFVAAVQSGSLSLNDLMAATGATSDTILGASEDTADFAEAWQLFKNRALLQVEPIAARVFNAMGDGMKWFNEVGSPALAQFAGVVADRLGPALDAISGWVTSEGLPALQAFGSFVTGTVIPAVVAMATWIAENETPIKVVAGVIGALLLPHLIRLGVVATVTKVQVVASWVAQQAAAIGATAASVAATYRMIGAWVAARVAAVASFGQTIAIMALYAAESIANAARATAAWVAAQARTVASLAVTAAGFVVQGAVMLASMAATAAGVVAGWVLMGVQAMLQAARMAAAWIIALGPIAWVIAAVVGLVALIIANWDTVVAWTQAAWSAAVGAVVAAWEWIKGAVSAGIDFLVMLFMNFTGVGLIIQHWETIKNATSAAWNWVVGAVSGAWNAVTSAVSNGVSAAVGFVAGLPGRAASALGSLGSSLWGIATSAFRSMWDAFSNGANNAISLVTGLPGRVVSAIGNVGSLLYDAGKKIIQGFINGITSAIGGVKDTLGGLTSKLTSWKGPPERDAVLLREAGQLVIGGFIGGLESRYGAVRSSLQGLTAGLAIAGPAMPAGLRGPITGRQAAATTSATTDGGRGIGTLVHIDDYHEAPGSSAQQNAQALVIEARTRGFG